MLDNHRGPRKLRMVNTEPASAEPSDWQAACRRQAAAIEALTGLVARLRSGMTALKAENAELRAGRRGLDQRSTAASDRTPSVQARVALGMCAPAAARRAVTRMLAYHVAPELLERAKLTISDLVTSTVRYGGAAQEGYLTVRAFLTSDHLRLEVEDADSGGMVADAPTDDGFGLRLVHSLSERWGTERSADGTVRAWAELAVRDTGAHATNGRRDAGVAGVVGGPGEVHVVPVPRAGTWALILGSVAGALSEHTTQTAAEAAAREEALRRGCRRIVVHDRYHRTRADTVTALD